MPRPAHTAAALALGVTALTACSSAPGPAATGEMYGVASAPEGRNADKPLLDFMKLSLKLTADCPPLDDTKTGEPLGAGDLPGVPRSPSSGPPGEPGDRVPLPVDPDNAPVADDPVPPPPDRDLLEPVTLTQPETCYADKFAAHVTTALKGTGKNSTEVRTALKRAGYPDELIVGMKPEGGSPRVRIDLREQDTRVALQVVHGGAGDTVVEQFGAQPTAPLKDVRYIRKPTGPVN
ncbi:hypothetical protein [Streptomyces sp. M54]|uniref:hypothetical protein n=1 Tax=Streptomyces sp. M54 TaxID=2759525 RepID=UPI001A8C10A3|nr:hypothetical protein [Streptomyces sp. M54]QSS90552.1 hypothetical protein H3V39_08860 [Streptomyces sp. M54]